ncbi:MAG: ArsB/NhaD family transporter [Planctomycetota bacterium]|jgi:Na+/H+ antiporter NhaD/arsenite permease-like protein
MITLFFAALLLATLFCLAFEVLPKAVLSLVVAGVALFAAIAWGVEFGHGDVGGHHVPAPVNLIEWPTLGVIIGSSIFVEIASRSGIFTWSAIRLLKTSGGDPWKLLLLLGVLTLLFSAFLNNVTAMIIVGSLTGVACRSLQLDARPYLLVEAFLTNVGGLLTLISSLPNIILGHAAGITFLKFFLVAAPYCVLAAAATFLLARKLFAIRPLADEAARLRARQRVEEFDEWETVQDRGFFRAAWFVTGGVILLFALQSYLPVFRSEELGLQFVAFLGATVMLVLRPKAVEEALRKVEWSLVFFFVGLFILVGICGHEQVGVLAGMGKGVQWLIDHTGAFASAILVWATGILSGLTDNVPLAAMLGQMLPPETAPDVWWAAIIGGNLGGNITPIGSAAVVVGVTLMRREGIRITFTGFMRTAAPFAIVQLLIGSGYLLVLRAVL